MTLATQGNILVGSGQRIHRSAHCRRHQGGDLRIQLTYPAKDGHVSITHLSAPTIGPATGG